MKHDYTALDSAIKAALATGPKKFRELENEPEIKRKAIKIAAAHNASMSDPLHERKAWHFIFRRIDAMEFQGVIQNGGSVIGWSLRT